MKLSHIQAIGIKQVKDTMKNKPVLIQFVMFPIMCIILTLSTSDMELPHNMFVYLFSSMYTACLLYTSGVSQVTIRKDLIQLENDGLIMREHGYATLRNSADISNRLVYHYEIKQKIAKLAVQSIADGETVMIESGSCCALVAMEIARTKQDVTLITNSAFIADYVRKTGNIRILLLGGEYQKESQVMVGPITRKCAETFFVDKLFIGTDGFTKEFGFTGNDYMRSESVRDMARQAEHVIVVLSLIHI